jgi:GNAT superfamily N-acetyltransferase
MTHPSAPSPVKAALGFESGVQCWARDGYEISTDRARLDLDAIHAFLANESSWAQGIDRKVVETAIAWSVPFGLYAPDGRLAGFARVVTDAAMFAYLRDVFILEAHRGRGLARWLVDSICAHPDLAAVRTWLLSTSDAHGLYEQSGFRPVRHPEHFMERRRQPTP